ncbi:MAG TPA: WhiB family transcriptional regulator [Rariglobus sp.]
MTTPPPDWTGALCAQTDGNLWFPDFGEPTRTARAICERCPLQDACLDYALTRGERFGVWGGVSERDRRKLRKAAA